jgi:hypothetical protein
MPLKGLPEGAREVFVRCLSVVYLQGTRVTVIPCHGPTRDSKESRMMSSLPFTAQRLPPADLGEPARQENVVQGVQEYLQITTTSIHMRSELESLCHVMLELESQAKARNHILILSSKSRRADGILLFRHMCHPGRCHSHSSGPQRAATGVFSTPRLTTCMCMLLHYPPPPAIDAPPSHALSSSCR